jgi:hypothetical protein
MKKSKIIAPLALAISMIIVSLFVIKLDFKSNEIGSKTKTNHMELTKKQFINFIVKNNAEKLDEITAITVVGSKTWMALPIIDEQSEYLLKIPSTFSKCRNLKEFAVDNLVISSIPQSFYELQLIEKLILNIHSNIDLVDLSKKIIQFPNLKYIFLAGEVRTDEEYQEVHKIFSNIKSELILSVKQ